jgi:adenosylmethionine-8-amino-7-oxononanoate aminotransferase
MALKGEGLLEEACSMGRGQRAGSDAVLRVDSRRHYRSIVRGEGIYLYDSEGNRYIDASGGPILCNLGHGIAEMAEALAEQAKKIAFVYRSDFTTPALEEAARKICELTGFAMKKVFLVSGGSEANEIAVKIARRFHLERGEGSKYKVISRWLSYHGMTQGALAWSGMPTRRRDYVPMLKDDAHIPPAYCYRCWFGLEPSRCDLQCARALEHEILCQGPENVAAFIAEPISGMSLCGAHPRADYFRLVREICDEHGVLLVLDEVMTGFGRTGKWFAYEHFGIIPDILTLGKGLGGGYFPVGAVAISEKVAKAIEDGTGIFSPGYSWAGNPLGAAVISRAIDYLKEKGLVERAQKMGRYLGARLKEELSPHPTVGDIRGLGLMWGVEFVKDKVTREPLDPKLKFHQRVAHRALDMGLFIESSGGCERGKAGDMIMFGPPFIVTEDEIDQMIELFERALTHEEEMLTAQEGP